LSSIVLVDTSILLNVLNVPGRNDQRDHVLAELAVLLDQQAHLFLPSAAIVECGNHIAHIRNGVHRRAAAERYVEEMRRALTGNAPWQAMRFPSREEVVEWLQSFPESAMAGIGMGDHSIIHEWEGCCDRYPMSRVRIWSLDHHLAGHDRKVD